MKALASLRFSPSPWITPLACIGCFVISNVAAGQSSVERLQDAIAKGDITVEAVVGTGGSSGPVIEGYLVNRARVDQYINIHLGLPIYFANRGKGQNMVATQVYRRDGSYLSDGTQGYVIAAANSRTAIVFIAYCADFDKENPTSDDLFTLAEMPSEINDVVRSIVEVEQANPDVELTSAAQLALWVARGASLEAINERFRFSENDVVWMQKILQRIAPRNIPQDG